MGFCRPILPFLIAISAVMPLKAQTEIVGEKDGFTLKKTNDSLYWINDFRLPYPVYQFQTGDVDGDGNIDAMVGVIKSTRFYSTKSRRIFIFKQINNKAPDVEGFKTGRNTRRLQIHRRKDQSFGIDDRQSLCSDRL